jgi:ABC-type antimicrobial peptide transport system permease subunit
LDEINIKIYSKNKGTHNVDKYKIFNQYSIEKQLELFLNNIDIKKSLMLTHRVVFNYIIENTETIDLYTRILINHRINRNRRIYKISIHEEN